MAQPPGNDTRASPQRAISGPSASIDARIVFTISYGASGQSTRAADIVSAPAPPSAVTPICVSNARMVRTSLSAGTLERMNGSGVSSAAHMIGSAAFFAPETRTSPSSATPPSMASFSKPLAPAFRGGQCLHREGVDLSTHSVAKGTVHQLVALDPTEAFERGTDDPRLEMLAIAVDLNLVAGKAGLDRVLDVVWGCHQLRNL